MERYFFSLSLKNDSSEETINRLGKSSPFMITTFLRLKELLKEDDLVCVMRKQTEETILPIGTVVWFFLDEEKRSGVAFRVSGYSKEYNFDLTESEVFIQLGFSNVTNVTEIDFANWIFQTKWELVRQLK